MEIPERLDLTAVEPQLWRPAILARYDALKPGQAFVVNNDAEARPLYHLLTLERGKSFAWEPIERGPERWITVIRKWHGEPEGETLANIVSGDYRKSLALANLGIDFSCNGSTTLRQAFEGKDDTLNQVLKEWDAITPVVPEKNMDFLGWNIAFLTKYIMQMHHGFVRNQTRFVAELAYKVADSNRSRNPEIREVADVFNGTGKKLEDLALHEEKELFPYLISLSNAEAKEYTPKAGGTGPVAVPISFIQAESEQVSAGLRQIREITHNYTVPAYTSSTCPILYKLLAAYEEDALLHLHLENNILFPKAVKTERSLRSDYLIS